MHIFIDESGVFTIPGILPGRRKWAFSCVGALVIPGHSLNEVFTEFVELKRLWGVKAVDEIKGSKLSESQFAQFVNFLSGYDVMGEITAIDMAMQTPSGILNHKNEQALGVVKHITSEFSDTLKSSLYETQKRIEKLSSPLYLQAVCGFELVHHILRKSTLYYAQRSPKELGDFNWEIDAKQNAITEYERLWQLIVKPILQSKSFREPLIQLVEADYSYFNKYTGQYAEIPDHLRGATAHKIGPFPYVSINKLFDKNVKVERSIRSLGLQMADIFVSNIRRAMNGNLRREGWNNVGALMVRAEFDDQLIQIIDVSRFRNLPMGNALPVSQLVTLVQRTAKPMLTETGE